MCNIREQLLTSANNGSLLEVAYQIYLDNRTDSAAVGKELALLHNQGLLDAIAEFNNLCQESAGHKFFAIRHVLEDALPDIDAPILDVMQCVKHLTEQGGQDLAAGMLFPPFTAYCQADDNRPSTVLELAVDEYVDWKDFIYPAIIAGARIELHDFVAKAIELTSDSNVEISSRAVFALGRINYCDDSDLMEEVLESLKMIALRGSNDQLFSAVLNSSYPLYLARKTNEQAVIDIFDEVLKVQGDMTLHSASDLFMLEKNSLPDSLVKRMLKAFEDVNPKNTGTLNNIDFGLEALLDKGKVEEALNLLELLLIKHKADLSVSQFDNLVRGLRKNPDNILGKTITRWFMSGVVRLGRSASEIINHSNDENINVSAVLEKKSKEPDGIHLFLAKKACGWFFFKPVVATRFIFSLIDGAPDEDVTSISKILFNPLLISYSGSVKGYLISLRDDSSEKVKDVIDQLLADLDEYHVVLKEVMNIKELEPSVSQREAYHRKMSREMAISYKEARKGSLLGDIFGKPSVLLYGNSSIHYIHNGPNGEKSRQEIPLQRFSTSIEFPSLENLIPHELELRLREYKSEGCTS